MHPRDYSSTSVIKGPAAPIGSCRGTMWGSLFECGHEEQRGKTRNSYRWVERRWRLSFTSLVEAVRSSLTGPFPLHHLASSSHSGSDSKEVRNFVISPGAPEFRIFGASLSEKTYTVGWPVPEASTCDPWSKLPTTFCSRGPSKASRTVAQERLM